MDDKNSVIETYKKQLSIFKSVGIIYLVALLIYYIITILNCQDFNLKAIIASLIFVLSIAIFMIIFTMFDIRRNRIIKEYYGIVSEEDRQKAKSLLDRISVVYKNEYDFYDILRYDAVDADISQMLKLLVKGKKIYIDLYKLTKTIEQEIINNKEKYTDEEFNDFIFELVPLLENNLCDL